MEDLKGKMMYGFKFSGGPGYSFMMKDLVGKEAVIESQHEKACNVRFSDNSRWAYPYPEILNHLVDKEDERTIDEIIIELKQLTSKL